MSPVAKRPLTFVAGYSESLWKSLVVKSLRIGWPIGLEEAAKHLPEFSMEALLVCGLFEDVFPPQSELADCIDEVNVRNYFALSSRETHHGRRLTEAFCSLEKEAVAAASQKREEISAQGKNWNVWLPPRSLNCFYTWLKLAPDDANVRRGPDDTPWIGMPRAMADGHTYEGSRLGTPVTLLSGHYRNHAALAERVMNGGWDLVRKEVHAELL